MFASDLVTEWNGKPSVVGPVAVRAPHAAQLAVAELDTGRQDDANDVCSEVTVGRATRPTGLTELHLNGGSKMLDVLRGVLLHILPDGSLPKINPSMVDRSRPAAARSDNVELAIR